MLVQQPEGEGSERAGGHARRVPDALVRRAAVFRRTAAVVKECAIVENASWRVCVVSQPTGALYCALGVNFVFRARILYSGLYSVEKS